MCNLPLMYPIQTVANPFKGQDDEIPVCLITQSSYEFVEIAFCSPLQHEAHGILFARIFVLTSRKFGNTIKLNPSRRRSRESGVGEIELPVSTFQWTSFHEPLERIFQDLSFSTTSYHMKFSSTLSGEMLAVCFQEKLDGAKLQSRLFQNCLVQGVQNQVQQSDCRGCSAKVAGTADCNIVQSCLGGLPLRLWHLDDQVRAYLPLRERIAEH